MILAKRLASCLLAKVNFCWLSSNIQTRCTSAVQCMSQVMRFLCGQSLHQLGQHWSQLPFLCKVTSGGPPVSIIRTMFLLQDVNKAFCIAHAGGVSMQTIRNSTISSQGTLCFSHCKVKVNEEVAFPATLLQHLYCSTWFACHPHHKHSLTADQPDLAQVVLLQCLQLFIGVHYQAVCVCLRSALKSQAGCMLHQCCPCAPGCICPVFTSVMATVTRQSSSHGTQCAAGSVHQMPSQLLLAKLLLFRQSLPRQAYLLRPL